MSHRFYHTEGLIIKSRERGEAGQTYLVFTRQLGLISAVAAGVRQSKSKLRPHLNSWQLANFTFVRGREVWRLIGAEVVSEARLARGALPVLCRFGRLLPRLLPFSSPVPEIFNLVAEGVGRIKTLAGVKNKELLPAAELLLVLRFLNKLGYLSEAAALPPNRQNGEWDDEGLRSLLLRRQQVVALINEALTASQL